jgi:bifunctional non-homologous end joining protein LigD
MSLQVYHKKRQFNKTPEPEGKSKKHPGKGNLKFVVQRHDASHLHYDFRLELNGVLKSWAIPKGPSMNPGDKRLAIMVEDHPLTYGKFEGVIPEGNYGAGTVEIWDSGTYLAEEGSDKGIATHLKKGSLRFFIDGTKLRGSFSLVRLKNKKENSWLLIKHKDEFATDQKYDPEKATTLEEGGNKQSRKVTDVLRLVRGGRGEKIKSYIKPMMAQLHDKPFDDPNWIFEIKWDGYRAVAEVTSKAIKLYSRNGLSFATMYPKIVTALQKIKEDVILDGEIVVIDSNNRPSFQKLQQYGEYPNLPIIYYVFDCLFYKGKDVTQLPLLERKKIVKKVLPRATSVIRYSDHVSATGKDFFEKVVEMDIEGMMAKRADSLYYPGKRTSDWLKVKHQNTQEAIIAGYTQPRGSRQYFGALLLAIKAGNKLKYIGHTGTGFTETTLKDVYLKLQPYIRKTSPFENKVAVNSPVTWVEPVLVCEVRFAELTNDGILRQPVFMGLRIDKPASEADHIDKPVTKSMKQKSKPAGKKEATGPSQENKKVVVNRHTLQLTNLNKLYWPEEKITKGELIGYYRAIGKYMLPHLKNRPQSLKRNPNGITDKGFYHKDAGDEAPSWVKSVTIHSESGNKDIEYIICNDQATLTYLNNLGCIEINPWNSTTAHLDSPDYLVIDLDPSDGNTFEQVIEAAVATKEVLDRAGAKSYCKTSGASGLHIYVPLKAAYTYEQVRPFAELIAIMTNQLLPDTTTTERMLKKRGKRIYLDHLQNKRGQTLAAVYSVRPVAGAHVSVPLEWKEVKNGLLPSDFNIFNTKKRVEKRGDLFANVLKGKTDIVKCLRKLEGK